MTKLAYALILVLGICVCESKETAAQSALTTSDGAVGKWVTDGGATTLVVEDGGAFVMDTKKGQHITGTWVLNGTTLSMTGSGEGAISGSFSGTLAGGLLKMRMGPKEVVYERR